MVSWGGGASLGRAAHPPANQHHELEEPISCRGRSYLPTYLPGGRDVTVGKGRVYVAVRGGATAREGTFSKMVGVTRFDAGARSPAPAAAGPPELSLMWPACVSQAMKGEKGMPGVSVGEGLGEELTDDSFSKYPPPPQP